MEKNGLACCIFQARLMAITWCLSKTRLKRTAAAGNDWKPELRRACTRLCLGVPGLHHVTLTRSRRQSRVIRMTSHRDRVSGHHPRSDHREQAHILSNVHRTPLLPSIFSSLPSCLTPPPPTAPTQSPPTHYLLSRSHSSSGNVTSLSPIPTPSSISAIPHPSSWSSMPSASLLLLQLVLLRYSPPIHASAISPSLPSPS